MLPLLYAIEVDYWSIMTTFFIFSTSALSPAFNLIYSSLLYMLLDFLTAALKVKIIFYPISAAIGLYAIASFCNWVFTDLISHRLYRFCVWNIGLFVILIFIIRLQLSFVSEHCVLNYFIFKHLSFINFLPATWAHFHGYLSFSRRYLLYFSVFSPNSNAFSLCF